MARSVLFASSVAAGVGVCLVVVIGAGPTALAQAPAPPPPLFGAARERVALEAFLDGVLSAQREAHHVAGATVAVVADGDIVLAKGYGHADLERGRRVEADRTLFRIASVTKLFTWTAVMQLVERGELDLDADVNRYLGRVRVPPTFPAPVTMRHLMTHTAGFEDRVIGLFARGPERLLPLERLFESEMPARVRPPGQLASYSNHGTALAGLIVERISGTSWEGYVEEHILRPLGMSRTTPRQPLPTDLEGDLAVGYHWADGRYQARGFEFVPVRPAGAMSATATDIARFMIAHLQDGRYGSTRILAEPTARQMHGRAFAHGPEMNGMLLGFFETSRNGRRIYGHDGDTFWFHSHLALLPAEGVGLFVSYNTDSGSEAREGLIAAFLDRYFPGPAPSAASSPPVEVARFAGTYAPGRVSETTLTRLEKLTGAVRVRATPEGQLVTTGFGPTPRRWARREGAVFREVGGGESLAFREDGRGRARYLFFDRFPPVYFVRLGPTETPAVQFTVLGICAAVLLSAVAIWPLGARRWRRAADGAPASRTHVELRVGWLAGALLVTFLLALSVVLADPTEIVFGLPPSVPWLLALPLVAALLTGPMIAFALRAWRRGDWHILDRAHYTVAALAAVALLVWLYRWNLLGFKY